MHFSTSTLITVVLAAASSTLAQQTTYSAWVSGSETSITFGQAQETSTMNMSGMSGMEGMTMSTTKAKTKSSGASAATDSLESATTGASFGLSATSRGAATVTSNPAQPMATMHVGAGLAAAAVLAYVV